MHDILFFSLVRLKLNFKKFHNMLFVFRVCLEHLDQKAWVAQRLIALLINSSDCFFFLSSKTWMKSDMNDFFISNQGDSGKPGFPGTLGSSGKQVSVSINILKLQHGSSLFCIILLLHHRVKGENREKWDPSDPSGSLWVFKAIWCSWIETNELTVTGQRSSTVM